MRKRITSLLLTLVMLLSLVPAMGVTASAADDFVKVSTYEELKNEVDRGDAKVKLINNIDTTNDNGGAGVTQQTALTFIGDGNILDLNGHTLKLVSNTGAIFFEVLKGLTIQDSGTGGRIDFEYGSNVIYRTTAIHVAPSAGAKLTVESGTLSSTYHGVTLIKSEGNLTIKGGKLEMPAYDGPTPQTIHTFNSYGDGCKVLISGGEIYGTTVFTRDDSSVEKFPQDGNYPIQITGGTMKGPVIPVWIKGGEPTNQTEYSPVIEITGGVIHNWGRTGFMASCKRLPTKVVKGSFKDGAIISVGDVKKTSEICVAALGQSAIRYNDEYGPSSQVCRGNGIPGGTVNNGGIAIYTNEDNPVTVIPNAWGIKSVKLDGKEISYAKDWNGEPMEIDNSKDHILTYEWYPLLEGLQDCHYKYDAMFQRYYDGDGGGHGEIITSGTQYSYTIKKGIEPKLYTFNLALDMLHNGKPFLNGHNNHAVKLMVKEAPPTPTIEGNVYYTSGIVYDRLISTGTGNLPHGFDSSKLLYQWQRSTNGGEWTDIDGATRGSYTPVAADMGDDVRIRVVVTAEGYLGEIVGAAVKVSKAANDSTPVPSTVVARKDGSDTYTKFEITDFNPNQEYVYTSSPDNSGEWPTGGTPINSATVEGLSAGSTYFIYTRCKETNTHQPGSKIISSSVLLDEETRLNRIILTDASGKEYSSYGNGNTIYIKKGESMTLTATKNPGGANKWSDFTFEPQYSSSAFTVTDPTGPVVSGATITSVTIRGEEVGTGTLAAKYSGYTPRYYGTWGIHVYEDVKDIGTSAEITVSPSFPDTTMYVGDTMTLPEYDVTVYPKGALDNYNLAWRIIKTGMGATYPMSDANITLEDGKIKAEAAHTGGEKTLLGLVAIDKTDSTKIISLSPTSRFYVTVTEAPTIALTGVTVAPTKVNLANVGDTYQLSAVKEPVNAAGSLNWESSNTGVATVDSAGMVTAKAQGTAIITVSCGDKKATCTVTVDHQHDYSGQPYLYLDPGNHYQECKLNDGYKYEAHGFTTWTPNSDKTTHSRDCTVCKMTDGSTYTETANHDWQWVVDDAATPNAAGKQHEECVDCHAKRSENTEIPMLTSIKVENLTVAKPVKDAAATKPTTTDSTYTVANTEWMAADGTPLVIGGKFQPGTVYTVKITLETAGAGVFSVNSTYNTIEGKTATVTPELTGIAHADSVVLTYTFDKTAGGYYPGTGTGTGTTTYPITVMNSKNGGVTVSHKSAAKGALVTLTVTPDKGYVLDTLTVLDGKDKEIKLTEKNGKYTFTMPDSKVTVAATFKASAPTGKNPFIDVPAGSYYEDAVVWAVEKGITSGTSTVTFDPNGNCTRAQAVTFLWRAAGSPAPKTKVMPFTDVPSGSYYYDAVLWAMEQGITKGTSDTAFSPNASCTRAQIVTFLWRANGSPVVSGNSAFTDVASDAYYAAAVAWAEKNGVTGGIGGGLFGSNNNCTRAQIVTFLYRAMK